MPAWFADRHILDIGNQTYSGDESNQFGLAKDLGSVADRQTIEQIEQHDGDEEDEQYEYDVTPNGMRDKRDVIGIKLPSEHDNSFEERATRIGKARVVAVFEERVKGQSEREDEERVWEEEASEIERDCSEHLDTGGHARMLTDQDHQFPRGQEDHYGADLGSRAAQHGESQHAQRSFQPIAQIFQITPRTRDELEDLPGDKEQQ